LEGGVVSLLVWLVGAMIDVDVGGFICVYNVVLRAVHSCD
jgi:hypothetical protein